MLEITISRESITEDLYQEIFEKESHHNHEIIKDEHGTLRWKRNDRVDKLVDEVGLNGIMMLFYNLGLTKNSELIRKMYREMGYSLYGYWEIFYWEVNNPESDEYRKNG